MNKEIRVLIIVPCYNERDSVGSLLGEIGRSCSNHHILVIDDGSIDDTFDIANANAPTVHLIRNLGIGGAVQTGIIFAARNGFDFCIQIDGDGQHPPSQVANLLKAYMHDPAQIIVGSRFLIHDNFHSTWARRLGGKSIAYVLNQLFVGCKVTDPTSGMRLMDRKAIDFFSRHYPYDFPEPISLAWALRAGMRVRDVPVEMRPRLNGESSIAGLRSLTYMFRVMCYILLSRVKRSALP